MSHRQLSVRETKPRCVLMTGPKHPHLSRGTRHSQLSSQSRGLRTTVRPAQHRAAGPGKREWPGSGRQLQWSLGQAAPGPPAAIPPSSKQSRRARPSSGCMVRPCTPSRTHTGTDVTTGAPAVGEPPGTLPQATGREGLLLGGPFCSLRAHLHSSSATWAASPPPRPQTPLPAGSAPTVGSWEGGRGLAPARCGDKQHPLSVRSPPSGSSREALSAEPSPMTMQERRPF